ncbi:putative phosphatidylglycerol/phosphatidylinositol transfer protein 2 [Dysidea avara]|uniref:putative phosphatidylglycerol/phosphatidylinositol transfer protein 2 n=1 Tax=Dysidea avara TaxID=196820 RepID=UPI003324C519
MKVDFVLAAFCLILVNANPSANQDANQDANPLVKESDEISCPTKDFSCANSSFDVTNLTLKFAPDPPEKGKNVTVSLTGTVKKKITVGEVQVVLKFGKLTVFAKTYDVCELAVKYGHGCPVLPGPMIFSGTFEVPSDLPVGIYKVTMDGTDQDDNHMICGTVRCQVTN